MKDNRAYKRQLGMREFSFAVAVSASLTTGQPAAAVQNQNTPQDVNVTIPIPAGGVCTFGVELSLSGKAKTIELPGGRVIFTSPGLDATVTNSDNPTKQITLNITGTFHDTTEQDGSVVTVVTGRNLLFDPDAGFVLSIGDFSYVFDADGNLVQPLEGRGQLIDVCAIID
jgi:hypothetical protein